MIDSSLTIIPIFIKFNLQVQKNAEWITNKLLQSDNAVSKTRR